jgi:FKBP-type peptidyl-prolyl cis-trans isomerase
MSYASPFSYYRPAGCAMPHLTKNGDKMSMQYTGWLFSGGKKGKKFDSSRNPGRSAFGFTLGAGQVIKVGPADL